MQRKWSLIPSTSVGMASSRFPRRIVLSRGSLRVAIALAWNSDQAGFTACVVAQVHAATPMHFSISSATAESFTPGRILCCTTSSTRGQYSSHSSAVISSKLVLFGIFATTTPSASKMEMYRSVHNLIATGDQRFGVLNAEGIDGRSISLADACTSRGAANTEQRGSA